MEVVLRVNSLVLFMSGQDTQHQPDRTADPEENDSTSFHEHKEKLELGPPSLARLGDEGKKTICKYQNKTDAKAKDEVQDRISKWISLNT